MTADEFAKILRKGGETLRVDDLVLSTGKSDLLGRGLLRLLPEKISIEMSLNPGVTPPAQRMGVFSKRDAWSLKGVIEDCLNFTCPSVCPVPSQNLFSRTEPDGSAFWRCKLLFSVSSLELDPCGLDCLNSRQKAELRRKLLGSPEGEVADATQAVEPQTRCGDSVVIFVAHFKDFPLQSANWDGPSKGEALGFDYELFERTNDEDASVVLRANEKYLETDENEHWRHFYAFMNALAFIHGTNAWPYRIIYRRDGVRIKDGFTAPRRLPGTSHSPFPDSLQFGGKTGSLKWSLTETLTKSVGFFSSDCELVREISRLMFLFRQAGDRVHGEITAITLCILFENLFQQIFQHLKLEEIARAQNSEISQFEQAKAEVLQDIGTKGGEGYARLAACVRSAGPFSQREKFKAVVQHLGLQWENDMEEFFKTWQKARNPLVHAKRRASQTEDEIKDEMILESRIAGVINVLVLKVMGYSGIMRFSAFEDQHRRI